MRDLTLPDRGGVPATRYRRRYTAVVPQIWEFVFLMLILKLPILYLAWVVYWAIKSEPRPPEYATLRARVDPDPRSPWTRPLPPRSPRRGPHGSPIRGYRRTARARVHL